MTYSVKNFVRGLDGMGKGNGCYIPNTPIVVDYWTIRGVPPKCVRFLTHMHSDHIEGLTRQFPYQIHCTPITARLLKQRFSFNDELLVELEYNEPMTVYVESVSGPQHSFTVTAFDAQHCPGAAIFLFEGEFGTILYTGDFRYEADEEGHYPELSFMPGLKSIDLLYLDNTYCDPRCKFPTRNSMSREICAHIRQFFASHSEGHVVMGMDTLGKENLLCQVALSLGLPIGVTQERLERLALIGLSETFTDDLDGVRIRVVQNRGINDRVIQEWNSEVETMVILPTARYSGPGGVPFNLSSPHVRVFLYSDHCSWDELHHFVRAVRPKKILPVVQFRDSSCTRCNMEVFRQYLDPTPLPPTLTGRGTTLDKSYLLDAPKHSVPRAPKKRISDTGASGGKAKRHMGVQYASPGKWPSPKRVGNAEQVEDDSSEVYRVVIVEPCNMWDRANMETKPKQEEDKDETGLLTPSSSATNQDTKSMPEVGNYRHDTRCVMDDLCGEGDNIHKLNCGTTEECRRNSSTTRKLPNSIISSFDRQHRLSVDTGPSGDTAISGEAEVEVEVGRRTEESGGRKALIDIDAVDSLLLRAVNETSKSSGVYRAMDSEMVTLGHRATGSPQCHTEEQEFVMEHVSSHKQHDCFTSSFPPVGASGTLPVDSSSAEAAAGLPPAQDESLSASIIPSPSTPCRADLTDGVRPLGHAPTSCQMLPPPDVPCWITPLLTAPSPPSRLLMFRDNCKQHKLVKGMLAEVEEYRRLRKLRRQSLQSTNDATS